MKSALPGIYKSRSRMHDSTIEGNHFLFLLKPFFLLLFGCMALQSGWSQNINDDGSVYDANAVGTTQDLTLPNNPQIKEISFSLVGGDGGSAEVNDQITIYFPVPPFSRTTYYNAKSNGGNGADVSATFPVGNGAGEIPLGSTIRFVEGARGQSGSSQGVLGVGVDYGGGGGGSAVLYDPPGPNGWTLLAVAGGGGGAYQGMAVYSDVDGDNGQGGRQAQGNGSGGNGNIAFGGGGGGANSSGGGVTCVGFGGTTTAGEGGAGGNSIGYGGSDDGCINLPWHNGGAGYGGGGAGAGVGGGGGGYTGGEAGAATEAGGGGQSYVHATATSSEKTNGGTDGSPDHGTITYQVTLNQPPVAQCINAIIFLDASGNGTLTTADINNGSYDPDGTIVSMSLSKTTFTCADVGNNTVTLTVEDNNTATDACQATVTVVDNIDPDPVCQNITVYLDASGNASITGVDIDGGSTDACGIASLTASRTAFTCVDVGPNTVTLTVEDINGNSSTCNSTITVLDTVSPVAMCQNVTIQLDASGNATITGADIDGGSTDACGIASLTASRTAFTCADVGPNTVTLTVEDNYGNSSTCTSTVTVEDNVPPDAQCKNITVQLDGSGNAMIVGADVDNGSTDACGIQSLSVSPSNFTCANLGMNVVILTVTDVNNNSSTCNAMVTVEDNLAPIVRTQAVTVILDNHGEASVSVAMIDDGSSDNCTIVDMWLEGQTDYDCGDEGVHEVQLKVEDQSGNIGTGYAQVTVEYFKPDFTNVHGATMGDTIHVVDCLPWDISGNDLVNYKTIKQHASLATRVYRKELPHNTPWGMYQLWEYEYVVKDECAYTYTFRFFLALYDLKPPTFQRFPDDTIVATIADLPEVDENVKILDVCLYVVWDTVVTIPVLDLFQVDTIGFTRRWIARDPVGHESFRDQMIWIGSGDRNNYGLITGRIADEDHIITARFAGEAGTNGIPVSLYKLDEEAGTRSWVSSWTTGDWQGGQGKYYFVPEYPGNYQVKIDSVICLVDTIKFDKELWSDTLEITAGEILDQGWVITHPCAGVEVVDSFVAASDVSDVPKVGRSLQSRSTDWKIFPNPSTGYLHIDIHSDDLLDFQLKDALGRPVKSGVYQRGQTIDVRGMNSGLYYLQLMNHKKILGVKKVLLME